MQDNTKSKHLDAELAKLKAIGIKEISKTTKMSSSKIEDVLEKRFDKIDKVRAKGFVAILEREYGVDLHDWITLQNGQQSDEAKSVAEVISKQDEEQRAQRLVENAAKEQERNKEREKKRSEQKKREHQVLNLALSGKADAKEDSESYKWIYAILVLILLVLMGYFAYKTFVEGNQQSTSIESPKPQAQSEDSEPIYDGVFFDAGSVPSESSEPADATQDTQEATATETPVVLEEAITDSTQNLQVENLEQPKEQIEQSFFFNNAQDSLEPKNDNEVSQSQPISDNILRIRSEHDLWLGVINLQTGSKEQFAYQKEYDIKLSPKMLFVMGHSHFTLTLNGENITHSDKHPVRMYYDGTSFIDINYARFKQLNGGLEW